MRRRVVITGMGLLSPIGNSVGEFAEGLLAGRSGVRPISAFDGSRHRCQQAAEIQNFDAASCCRPDEIEHLSRGTQLVRVAAEQALADAGLDLDAEDRQAIGVVLGTDLGGMPASSPSYQALHYPYRTGISDGSEPWRSHLLDSFICSVADQLALHYQLNGLTMVVSTACSAGLHALGIGAEAIRSGDAELMMVGGVDPLSEMPQAGFGVLRALAADTIRPFDRQRDGTVLGEAAAIAVLESEEHARARGARVWAEITGYGGSTDAYHMTRPDISGDGPARAMRSALEDAGLEPEAIGYIKAHATATPANDSTETRAIQQVFGAETQIPVSSIKSMIGHSLGASGAIEALGAVLALVGGFLPPTLNMQEPDPECALAHVTVPGERRRLDAVLANAFGFGGNNASMVFERASEDWQRCAW